jgi:hypothetical protein
MFILGVTLDAGRALHQRAAILLEQVDRKHRAQLHMCRADQLMAEAASKLSLALQHNTNRSAHLRRQQALRVADNKLTTCPEDETTSCSSLLEAAVCTAPASASA